MSGYLTPSNAASCGTILHGLRPLFPPSLLADAGWERLLQVAGALPAVAARHLGFEFRLNNPVPAADFFVAIAPGTDIAQHVVHQGQAAKPGSAAAALGWCIAQLDQPDSFLSQWADLAILEYDLAEIPVGTRPEPSLFLRLRSKAEPDIQRFLASTLAIAVGWTEDSQECSEVERACVALPPKAMFMHLGAMPERALRAIRVVVSRIAEEEVPGFLTRLRYPGPIQPVEAVLACLRDVYASLVLSIDVTQRGLLPHLGLELYVARGDWTAAKRSDWLPLIARLEERGWCSSAKAHGLRSWSGSDKIFAEKSNFFAHRGINHVKITVGEAVTQVKAYCGLGYLPIK